MPGYGTIADLMLEKRLFVLDNQIVDAFNPRIKFQQALDAAALAGSYKQLVDRLNYICRDDGDTKTTVSLWTDSADSLSFMWMRVNLSDHEATLAETLPGTYRFKGKVSMNGGLICRITNGVPNWSSHT